MRVVGLDVGRKRIGLAISDRSGTLATPWRTVCGAGPVREVVSRIVELLAEFREEGDEFVGIVVGLPSHLDGRPHEQRFRVGAIAKGLEERTGLSVKFQDERLTSVEAEQRLMARERDWRKRKPRLDAAAAAVILQDYLDSCGGQKMSECNEETGVDFKDCEAAKGLSGIRKRTNREKV